MQSFSYQHIYHAVLQEPHALALLPDEHLLKLIHTPPPQQRIQSAILGESLFRFWLFRDTCDSQIADTLPGKLPRSCVDEIARLAANKKTVPLPDIPEHWRQTNELVSVWRYFHERANAMQACDGIIPVAIGQSNQALPIPFVIQFGEQHTTCVRDAAGISLPEWNVLVEEILNEHHCGIRLLIRIGSRAEQLCGGSCALPILIALAQHSGDIGKCHPLDILATGVVSNGHIQPTGSLEAKQALARRMGCTLFAAPGPQPADNTINLPVNTPVHRAIQGINNKLQTLGVTTIPSNAVAACLQDLIRDVHYSSIPLSHAEKRLAHIEHSIAAMAPGAVATEQNIKANLLHGTICNYHGNPQAGKKYIAKALETAETEALWMPYVNAVANQIVSLTDLGHLDDARAMGLALIDKINQIGWSGAHDRLAAAKTAYGVTGGQPLYQTALKNNDKDAERLSFDFLTRACTLAQELENKEGIARGTAQIFLWHASFHPENADPQFTDACRTIDALGKDAAISRTYLQRARYYGAYRHYITTRHIHPDFASWHLPQIHTAQTTWLYATALKYRGTLYAAQEKVEQAISDFNTACKLLDHEASPLLRFIGATAALQAAQSLKHTDPVPAGDFLKQAVDTFQSLENVFPSEFGINNWIVFSCNSDTPNPQTTFAY
jgi:tetratricopeptide (TPR) repeat protein